MVLLKVADSVEAENMPRYNVEHFKGGVYEIYFLERNGVKGLLK